MTQEKTVKVFSGDEGKRQSAGIAIIMRNASLFAAIKLGLNKQSFLLSVLSGLIDQFSCADHSATRDFMMSASDLFNPDATPEEKERADAENTEAAERLFKALELAWAPTPEKPC